MSRQLPLMTQSGTTGHHFLHDVSHATSRRDNWKVSFNSLQTGGKNCFSLSIKRQRLKPRVKWFQFNWAVI